MPHQPGRLLALVNAREASTHAAAASVRLSSFMCSSVSLLYVTAASSPVAGSHSS